MTILIRRAKYISIAFRTGKKIEIKSLLSGGPAFRLGDEIVANTPYSPNTFLLTPDEVMILALCSEIEWKERKLIVDTGRIQEKLIDNLIESNFLIENSSKSAALIDKEKRLDKVAWDNSALSFHFSSRYTKVQVPVQLPANLDEAREFAQTSESRISEHIEKYGLPPSHFYSRESAHKTIQLGNSDPTISLAELLKSRQTTRFFDMKKQVSKNSFDSIMQLVFGFHGYAKYENGVEFLKKTSPSGGALHPVEVYPLIINVEGYKTGLYHYHVGQHALEPQLFMKADEARNLVTELTTKQNFYATAHVVLFYTARFQRKFWKYRQHKKAYKVLLMDTAHLSQTLYLLCTDMKLGAFYTHAFNDLEIEKLLDIDPYEEGIMGVGGFGVPVINKGYDDFTLVNNISSQ